MPLNLRLNTHLKKTQVVSLLPYFTAVSNCPFQKKAREKKVNSPLCTSHCFLHSHISRENEGSAWVLFVYPKLTNISRFKGRNQSFFATISGLHRLKHPALPVEPPSATSLAQQVFCRWQLIENICRDIADWGAFRGEPQSQVPQTLLQFTCLTVGVFHFHQHTLTSS